MHIPNGGVQKRKTDRNCTFQKKENKKSKMLGMKRSIHRGVEDGLIGSWLDFFTTLTVVLCHI